MIGPACDSGVLYEVLISCVGSRFDDAGVSEGGYLVALVPGRVRRASSSRVGVATRGGDVSGSGATSSSQ